MGMKEMQVITPQMLWSTDKHEDSFEGNPTRKKQLKAAAAAAAAAAATVGQGSHQHSPKQRRRSRRSCSLNKLQ